MSKFLSLTAAGLICAATVTTALAAGAAHGRVKFHSTNTGYDRSTKIEHVSRRKTEAAAWADRAVRRHGMGMKGSDKFWTPPVSSSSSSMMNSSMSSSAAH
jgi:hypothetical protein